MQGFAPRLIAYEAILSLPIFHRRIWCLWNDMHVPLSPTKGAKRFLLFRGLVPVHGIEPRPSAYKTGAAPSGVTGEFGQACSHCHCGLSVPDRALSY